MFKEKTKIKKYVTNTRKAITAKSKKKEQCLRIRKDKDKEICYKHKEGYYCEKYEESKMFKDKKRHRLRKKVSV
jgi:hypothetical protein